MSLLLSNAGKWLNLGVMSKGDLDGGTDKSRRWDGWRIGSDAARLIRFGQDGERGRRRLRGLERGVVDVFFLTGLTKIFRINGIKGDGMDF
jgi:hypothetical protein